MYVFKGVLRRPDRRLTGLPARPLTAGDWKALTQAMGRDAPPPPGAPQQKGKE